MKLSFSVRKGVNFFLRADSSSVADFYHGTHKVGRFVQHRDAVWTATFVTAGGKWTAKGELQPLFEAASKFKFFSEERIRLMAPMPDGQYSAGLWHLKLVTMYRGVDPDLAKAQEERNHVRQIEQINELIEDIPIKFQLVTR